jgi:hypothetical protein
MLSDTLAHRRRGYVLALLTLTVTSKRWGDRLPSRDDLVRLYRETAEFLREHYSAFVGRRSKSGRLYPDRKRPLGAGWIAAVETGTDNNNAHCHAIIYGPIRAWSRLRDSWSQITGDSWGLDIKEVRNPAKAADYVLKYICKPPATDSYERLADWAMFIKGTRRLRTGGVFFNRCRPRDAKRTCECAVCGGRLMPAGYGLVDLVRDRIDLWPALDALLKGPRNAPGETLPVDMPLWHELAV